MAQQIKLNLGSGPNKIDGYQNLDVSTGTDIYPLPYPDESIDEIRASHVLEHFPHKQTQDVLNDWVKKLKPGGTLKIAVPNFSKCATMYAKDVLPKDFWLEGVMMGGHVDEHDVHHAIFDRNKLCELFKAAGLLRIEEWQSQIKDGAALPISLNLQGVKAKTEDLLIPKVAVNMSVPRLGFMDNFFSCFAFQKFGWPIYKYTGAFWGQCLERIMEDTIKNVNPEFILTVDYDSIFDENDVRELLYLARSYPEYDAFAPLQVSRSYDMSMFTRREESGELAKTIDSAELLNNDIIPAETAHFGLTLIRTESLKDLPHPWFQGQPGPDGKWGNGRTDDDIAFWHKYAAAGKKLGIATRVPIGHLELMIRWPSQDFATTVQSLKDYHEDNQPPRSVWK